MKHPALARLAPQISAIGLVFFAIGPIGLIGVSGACAAAPNATTPVAAPLSGLTDSYHGVAVQDPYRRLENVNDPKVRRWLLAQGASARTVLDAIPGRSAMLQRIQALEQNQGDVEI